MSQKYLTLEKLLGSVPHASALKKLWADHRQLMESAPGSSHNHQAWPGGYKDHVVECLNIANQLYSTLSDLRSVPFSRSEALEVMFLHDIEKPFKSGDDLSYPGKCPWLATKENRRQFRSDVIAKYGITLTPEQENALRYVEGVPDSEYTPGERTMGELAAFCHCCDILSARLWHDKGNKVPAPDWE